jgi:hypothetical protein
MPRPTLEASESTGVSHGYKVKRTVPKLTHEEQQQKENLVTRVMSEAMQAKAQVVSKKKC